MNVATFAGRVGADAELSYTKTGMAVASFSIAIDNGKDKSGERKAATWIKAVLWDKRAESLAPYVKKGAVVVVSGPVTTEAWISKQSGDAQSKMVVNVNQFTFGGSSNNADESAAPASPSRQAPPAPYDARNSSAITDEDIPF